MKPIARDYNSIGRVRSLHERSYWFESN